LSPCRGFSNCFLRATSIRGLVGILWDLKATEIEELLNFQELLNFPDSSFLMGFIGKYGKRNSRPCGVA
jgi:hypothetical protein